MVVLEHEALHQTLWGPGTARGRSRATDVAIYLQLVPLRLLCGGDADANSD